MPLPLDRSRERFRAEDRVEGCKTLMNTGDNGTHTDCKREVGPVEAILKPQPECDACGEEHAERHADQRCFKEAEGGSREVEQMSEGEGIVLRILAELFV